MDMAEASVDRSQCGARTCLSDVPSPARTPETRPPDLSVIHRRQHFHEFLLASTSFY